MTQSGELSKKIKLGKIDFVTDDQGFQSRKFIQIATPWAKVTNVAEPITVNGEKENVAQERVSFEIYYREGVTKGMIVNFKGKNYSVTSLYNPNFENKMLILHTERDDSLKEVGG